MSNKTLKKILDEKTWRTSTIISGLDKGAIQSRDRSINEIMDRVEEELIVVCKSDIDSFLDLISEYVAEKIKNPQVFEQQPKPIKSTTTFQDYENYDPGSAR